MNLFVKICGITRTVDAVDAVDAGADAIGIVAHPKSPRFISAVKAAPLVATVPVQVEKVGVFVNSPPDVIADYVRAGVTIAQLHGDESIATVERLRARFPNLKIWKAIQPRTRGEVEDALDFPVDMFLIDAFSPRARGGTGVTADWSLAALAVDILPKPVVLAGGLDPENVAEAIRRVRPAGVDASSGLERAPGIKDSSKTIRFITKISEINA